MGGGTSNFGGVSPQIMQQLGIDGPVTNQVFVANVSKTSVRQDRVVSF